MCKPSLIFSLYFVVAVSKIEKQSAGQLSVNSLHVCIHVKPYQISNVHLLWLSNVYNGAQKLLAQLRKSALFRFSTSNKKLLLETIWSS